MVLIDSSLQACESCEFVVVTCIINNVFRSVYGISNLIIMNVLWTVLIGTPKCRLITSLIKFLVMFVICD